MMQFPVADGRRPHHERTIGDRVSDGIEFFGAREQLRSSHGGARFAKRDFVGSDHAQAEKSEVAHGASGGANIERVARAYQDDAHVIEFGPVGQAAPFYIRGSIVDDGSVQAIEAAVPARVGRM